MAQTSVYTIERLEERTYLALPSPWLETNVGSPAAGSGQLNGGTYTIRGAGTIGGTADKLRYSYQRLSGDGYVVARVNDIQSSDPLTRAGVMIRESLSAGSKFADIVINDGGGARFQYRLNTSGNMSERTRASVTTPGWVKLERSRNTLKGYTSSDGLTWTLVGQETITMSANAYIGLAVSSHSTSTLATAMFSGVVIPQNILHYGASTSAADNTTAINNAIATSGNSGNVTFVPAGKFRHSSPIEVTGGKTLFGLGKFGVNASEKSKVSELVAFNATVNRMTAPVRLSGSGAGLRDIRISQDYDGIRLQNDTSVGVYAQRASNFVIQRVEVASAAGAGMMITHGSTNGLVTDNKVHGSLADGIHITNGANKITVTSNTVYQTGDDLIATVGYDGKIDPLTGENWLPPSNITITNNNVYNTGMTHGRGIAAVGSHNVLIDNNTITDAAHTGIIIVSEDAYGSLSGNNITVTRNRIINPNTQALSGPTGNHGGIYIGGRDGFLISNVTIGDPNDSSKGNIITNANGPGISISDYTSGIGVYYTTIIGTTGYGVRMFGANDVSVTNNTISNVGFQAIYLHGANTGTFVISDNRLNNANRDGASTNDAIQVAAGGLFSSLAILNNDYTNPANYTLHRFIEVHFATAIVTGNTTNTGKGIYVGS